ncbi:MAG: hypothetical protein ACRBN8_32325 [Nannocystales bacterium]
MNYSALLLRLAFPVVALSTACDGETLDATQSTVSGVQSFCVEAVDGADGAELEVNVQLDACLSSSCDTLIESKCTLTEVDGALQIEASAILQHEGDTCTADCRSINATCTIPAPLEETYIVRGDDGDEVTVDTADHDTACSVEPT